MKRIQIGIASLIILVTMSAQAQKSTPAPMGSKDNASAATVLESKIRKAWEDYKNRNKEAFAAILADGFSEVTNDADGIFDTKTELAEIDHFHLSHYELKDFQRKPIGDDGALMTYTAEYSGSYLNEPIQMKAIYGEVWVNVGSEWKLLWVQETKLK